MSSILGRTWVIYDATEESPFQAGDQVEITPDAKVKYKGQEWQGTYNPDKNQVIATPDKSEHWEFVGSEAVELTAAEKKFTMFGFSWTSTVPDALGSWVSDPQGTP